MGEEPDADRVTDAARRRQHERAQHVVNALEGLDARFGSHDYPVSSEELAVEYADQELDLPNETESLGSVFDRLVDEEFDSPEAVREAVYGELTGRAAGPEEYNDERPLEQVDAAEPGHPEGTGRPGIGEDDAAERSEGERE